MKIIYNPFFTGNVYLDHNLWDEVTVGDAALLGQLLMRAGMPQTVADADPDPKKNKEDDRIAVYQKALENQGTTIFSQSLHADADGTAKQLLQWRDMLVMAGWTPELTKDSENEKLRILALCDDALKGYPSSADRWRQVLEALRSGKKILQDHDSIEIQVPCELIHPLIKQVLDLLPNVTDKMDDKLDTVLSIEAHTGKITILAPHEQYEAWQLLPMLGYDANTMLVCDDEKRLNDTMAAIGGADWQTDRVGCPHSTRSIFDQMDRPTRLIWLDCAGNRPNTNPYAFLTTKDLEDLGLKESLNEETRSARESEWLYTLLNRIDEWILVAPKCHMGESLGEHPVITSIKRYDDLYKAACEKGSKIALPMTDEKPKVTLEEIGDIHLDDPQLITRIIPPTDSYSTIEQLVDTPMDYVLEKLGGLKAPEDDEEPNDHLMMGPIAHKMVELLVNKGETGAYSMKEIRQRFVKEYDSLFEQSMKSKSCKKEAEFLRLPENVNKLAVFKDELHESIKSLLAIIEEKGLTPFRCEYEIKTPFGPFAHPHGFVDLLLKDKGGDWVIFDFKWSSRDKYPEGLEKGKAYQLYMYQHGVEAQLGGHVAWYGYYLFPDMKLYDEENEAPKWDDWLERRQDRLSKMDNGTIVKSEEEKRPNSDVRKYASHLILKNMKIK
jgi:hypothetical protein